MEALLLYTVLAHGCAFLLLTLAWLLGAHLTERMIARLSQFASLSSALSLAALLVSMWRSGVSSFTVSAGNWFAVGEYHFPLTLLLDRLSFVMLALTIILVGAVAGFSVRYLHRDVGFFRFFSLMHLFAFGSALLFTAGSLDLLIGGWELVGITSVFLIAFFQERREPVRGAMYVFAVYRGCDLGLLLGVFVLHHLAGSASPQTSLEGSGATVVGLLLLLAAAGKSAQVPFSGWLPRAMEGPTPSSAIFYGAISVHAGAYLLLRMQSIFDASPVASAALVVVGLLTAVHGTLCHRVATDAKTSIAYAAVTQLGIIFAEIGFGFSTLALIHIMGHATIRTLQFLRAPSMLHDFRRVHSAAGGNLPPTGSHYKALLPVPARLWLYRFSLERGYHDAMLDRFVVRPAVKLSQWLADLGQPPGGPGWSQTTPAVLPSVPENNAKSVNA